MMRQGENWTDEDFDGIVGWKLPNTWATSVPLSGLLTMRWVHNPAPVPCFIGLTCAHFRYTSSGPGCAPVWQERLSLLAYVLCNKQ